jgi:hypothetical protein
MNLTKTVRKVPISLDFERMGAAMEDSHKVGPKYDDEAAVVRGAGCLPACLPGWLHACLPAWLAGLLPGCLGQS